jgi:hypothetical protein
MSDTDERCCGADVCIIEESGRCWCGQVWDGEKMVMPAETKDSETTQNNTPEKNRNIQVN